MKNILKLSGLLLSLSLLVQTASALTVNSPGVYIPNGTTAAAEPQLAGTVLEDELQTITFNNGSTNISFAVQNRVVRANDGTLDFYWRIRDVDGKGLISALRIINFTGVYDNNINYRIDGLGNRAPDDVKVFDNEKINYRFSNGIQENYSSKFLMIDTDATHYAKTAQYDFTFIGESQITGLYNTFAPAEVPVPAAVWLLGSALVGLVGVRRKK